MPDPIIVGYTVGVRDPETARNHLGVQPPGNLKKPESIQAWRDDPEKQREAWAKIDALAAWVKLTGKATHIMAVNLAKETVFDSSTFEDADAGTKFVQWLMQDYFFPTTPGSTDHPLLFYGFNPKPLLRLAGMSANRSGVYVPLGLWYSGYDAHVLDPQEMLLESEVKKIYSLEKICGDAPGGPIALAHAYRPHVNAAEDVRVATELCLRYNLMIPIGGEGLSLEDTLAMSPELGFQDVPAEAEAEEAEGEGEGELTEEPSEEPETEKKTTTKKKPTKKKPAAATK